MSSMTIEGEPTKRYRLSYHGSFLGSHDTARETLKAYENHNKLIRPVVDRKQKARYAIHDGKTKEITIADLRRAAKAEG
jgi:hypothetical protein